MMPPTDNLSITVFVIKSNRMDSREIRGGGGDSTVATAHGQPEPLRTGGVLCCCGAILLRTEHC